MAEGGAEDDVLDDRNGSFQNQSEEASTSKRSSRRTSVETVSAWAEQESPRGNRTTGITEHQQAEKRRKEVVRFPRPSSDWF